MSLKKIYFSFDIDEFLKIQLKNIKFAKVLKNNSCLNCRGVFRTLSRSRGGLILFLPGAGEIIDFTDSEGAEPP